MEESTATLLKCILTPLMQTLKSDKSDKEKYQQLTWYIKGMTHILFPEESFYNEDEEISGECMNHEK